MKLYRLLRRRLAGRTVGEWLACLAVSPSGAVGWALVLEGRPWAGILFLSLAQLFYHLVMGHDVDDS